MRVSLQFETRMTGQCTCALYRVSLEECSRLCGCTSGRSWVIKQTLGVETYTLLCNWSVELRQTANLWGAELKLKNNWWSKHLAFYETRAWNSIASHVRDECRKHDISPFAREVYETQQSQRGRRNNWRSKQFPRGNKRRKGFRLECIESIYELPYG